MATRLLVCVMVGVAALVAMPTSAQAAISAGRGDVFAVAASGGSGKTEVHALRRADAYHSFSVHAATGLGPTDLSTWTFGIGDYDGDGVPDFWAVNSRDNGGRNTAAHVFSGASNFQTAILHKQLPSMGAADLDVWQFFVGDYNGDGRADLYAVNSRDSGGTKTAAHVWNAASSLGSFLLHKQLPQMGSASLDVWQFAAGDYNGDGRADLYAVNTRDNGGRNTAAHVFDAAAGFGSFLLHKQLPGLGPASLARWQFTVGDHNTDGRADLVAVDSQDAGTGSTAIHVLDAANGFGSYLAHSGSALHQANLAGWQFHGWPGPSGGTAPPSGNAFIDSVVPGAQQIDRAYGIPASVAIGQAILESAWGTSTLARNDKNLFGIKCTSAGSPGPRAIGCHAYQTTECTPTCHPVTSYFRVYRSYADSLLDYADILRLPRYANAFNYTHDPNRFITEVWRAGYATDPNYPNKVINLMQSYNLYRYNV